MTYYKEEIANGLKSHLEGLTVDNGYSIDVKRVEYEEIIEPRQAGECPYIQIVDLSKSYQREQFDASKSYWVLSLEVILKSDRRKAYKQSDIWKVQQDIVRVLANSNRLGLDYINQIHLDDEVTSIEFDDSLLVGYLGLRIEYRERLRA